MDNLVINQNGKLVVTSRQIADNFEKENKNVVRAIEDKIKSLTAQNCTVDISKLFMPTTFNHNGNEYKEYLLTRDGFTFIVMGFTGAKADSWKLKYIEAFNAMEETLKNPYQGLSKEVQAIFALDKKQQEIDTRLTKLENDMVIDYSQQEELRTLVNKVVVNILEYNTPAYKELNKKTFSAIWKDFKRVFKVNSYKNTAVAKYEEAKEFLRNWKPSRELELMIMGANSQVSIGSGVI